MTRWGLVAVHDLLLVAVGLSLEVIFTAVSEHGDSKNWRLLGYTYIWMIPIYALVYPLLNILYPRMAAFPFYERAALYVGMIYFVEYVSGWLIRKAVGQCPWEEGYYKARWGVHGLIRLDFAPAWVAVSFIFETVFRVLRGI